MTREQLAAWRRWLDRVERRCDVEDVPLLVRRLGRALDDLRPYVRAEPVQMRLDDAS